MTFFENNLLSSTLSSLWYVWRMICNGCIILGCSLPNLLMATPSSGGMPSGGPDTSIVESPITAPSGSTASIHSMQASNLLNGIQNFYSKINDFQANFTQTFTYKIYAKQKRSHGKVYFKKPSKMRWDYQKPSKRLFIADGAHLWVYEPDEAQIFKRDMKRAQLPVALRFMKGEGDLASDFIASKPILNGEYYTLTLTPKEPSSEYQQLKLTVHSTTFEVSASELIDPVGNTNHIHFTNVKVNSALPDKGFQFTPPPGVHVIGESSLTP